MKHKAKNNIIQQYLLFEEWKPFHMKTLFSEITQSKSVVKLKGFCPFKYSKISFKIYTRTQRTIQCRFNCIGVWEPTTHA